VLCAEEVGRFSTKLYSRTLDAVLTSQHCDPAVLAHFLSTYLEYADCRFFLLRWVQAMASKRAKQEKLPGEGRSEPEDIVLTLFDALTAANTAVAESKGMDGGQQTYVSWSGAVEAGVSAAAATQTFPHESSSTSDLSSAQIQCSHHA
jgi:hypothetical protein